MAHEAGLGPRRQDMVSPQPPAFPVTFLTPSAGALTVRHQAAVIVFIRLIAIINIWIVIHAVDCAVPAQAVERHGGWLSARCTSYHIGLHLVG